MANCFINFLQYYIFFTLISAVLVIVDLCKRPQSMRIMNVVWVISIIWSGVLGLIIYFCIGRESRDADAMKYMEMSSGNDNILKSAIISTLYCGAGCTIADMIVESVGNLLNMAICYRFTMEYILALIFGFAFQYIAIIEMERIGFVEGIKRAVKADFLPLSAWQLGMYVFMFYVIYGDLGGEFGGNSVCGFLFLKQISMLIGFLFSYPINVGLIRLKIKRAM